MKKRLVLAALVATIAATPALYSFKTSRQRQAEAIFFLIKAGYEAGRDTAKFIAHPKRELRKKYFKAKAEFKKFKKKVKKTKWYDPLLTYYKVERDKRKFKMKAIKVLYPGVKKLKPPKKK